MAPTPPPDPEVPDPVSSGDLEIDALVANAKGALWHIINEMEALAASVKAARAEFEAFRTEWQAERGSSDDRWRVHGPDDDK
jgi:hypothetical protein